MLQIYNETLRFVQDNSITMEDMNIDDEKNIGYSRKIEYYIGNGERNI